MLYLYKTLAETVRPNSVLLVTDSNIEILRWPIYEWSARNVNSTVRIRKKFWKSLSRNRSPSGDAPGVPELSSHNDTDETLRINIIFQVFLDNCGFQIPWPSAYFCCVNGCINTIYWLSEIYQIHKLCLQLLWKQHDQK